MLSQISKRVWCHSYRSLTSQEVRYLSEPGFVEKVYVCEKCGGKMRDDEDEDWGGANEWDEGEDEGF